MKRNEKMRTVLERAASSKLVLSLVRRSNEAKTRMQSISGEIGQEIKAAVENEHLHAGALKAITKLARADELKRVAFLRAFDLYRKYAEEAHLFGEDHVGDLVDEAEAASEEALVEGVPDNLRRLSRGINKIIGSGARPSDTEEPLPPAA